MKYEKPDLEELDLELEGSFLEHGSKPGDAGEGGDKGDQEIGGDNGGDDNIWD